MPCKCCCRRQAANHGSVGIHGVPAGAFTAPVIFTKWEITPACPKLAATFKQRHPPKFPAGKNAVKVKTSYCARGMIEKTRGGGVCVWVVREVSCSHSTASLWWCDLPGMAAVALVTNTSSPEPRNGALLNFMKGLAVQFMSLPAEDMYMRRARGNTAALHQMRLHRTKSFTPDSTFFSRLYSEMQTQDMRVGLFQRGVKQLFLLGSWNASPSSYTTLRLQLQ